MKGKFIVLEGSDGSGKSTLAQSLKEYFEGRGQKVLWTREPGGTDLGEILRDLILKEAKDPMSSRTEALLYAASRAEHVEKKIRPALERGEVVLCERFVYSSIAYQGYGRQLDPKEIEDINLFATGGLRPDATFYLKVDWRKTLGRKTDLGGDRLEQAGDAFFNRVQEGYRALEKRPDIQVIQADESPEKVLAACIKVLEEKNG